MKTINTIPTGKVQRASKLIATGAKVGVNYLKYNIDKTIGSKEEAKQKLDESNAADVYDSLKDLKGSALKVAQMLSMEKTLMPKAYVEKFSLSQFSVPPLSAALVIKTFKKYFQKSPTEIFDSFDLNAKNAASIGQVHRATLDDKNLAVKIQYPGVANSISSDLALVKPVAIKMFNIKSKGADKYFKEVENKLIEETDYNLELKQSLEVSEKCKKIPNLLFPKYYADYSTERIITMDWMEGKHLSEFNFGSLTNEDCNKLGQALWDFYMFQIHELKKVHADPHPGNFLIADHLKLIAIDFGCMKEIPQEFYIPYFELATDKVLDNDDSYTEKLYELEILTAEDNDYEIQFFKKLFHELLSLFTKPFQSEIFNFSDETFFDQIKALSQKFNNDSELKKMNGNRGSKHFIYMNRTFFGLYNLMHDIGANHVIINNYKQYL